MTDLVIQPEFEADQLITHLALHAAQRSECLAWIHEQPQCYAQLRIGVRDW